jgi:hypothetical protein
VKGGEKYMTCRECGKDISTVLLKEAKDAGFCIACWDKPFPITSVCRADLLDKFTPNQIAKFDNGEMQYLAGKLADAYMNVFWIDLEILAESILEDK